MLHYKEDIMQIRGTNPQVDNAYEALVESSYYPTHSHILNKTTGKWERRDTPSAQSKTLKKHLNYFGLVETDKKHLL